MSDDSESDRTLPGEGQGPKPGNERTARINKDTLAETRDDAALEITGDLDANTIPVGAGGGDGSPLPEVPGVTLHGLIGEGGQAKVYKGRHTFLGREVAVKILESGATSTFTERFQREAKLLAEMQDPFIVACYDAGTNEAGQCFIVMEFIDGPDLSDWVAANGVMQTKDALVVVRDVAKALQHAHTINVIHRDVKPQNILLQPIDTCDEDEFCFRAKLADLGLARGTGDSEYQGMTATGLVMGTPATMALEQFDDPDSVDFRADIYGLGCVLFHALAGRPAFGGMRPSEVFMMKVKGTRPNMAGDTPSFPRGVDELVRCMMESNRDKRPQSYEELIERIETELHALETGVGTGAGTGLRRKVGFGIAGTLVALAALLYATRSGEDPGVLDGNVDGHSDGTNLPRSSGLDPVERHEGGPKDLAHRPVESRPSEQNAEEASGKESPLREASSAGTEAMQPVAPVAEAEIVEPYTLLAKGETQRLFEVWEKLDGFLQGWEVTPPGAFSAYESEYALPMTMAGMAAATRPLPEGSWRLTGEVLVERPWGGNSDDLIQGGVRIEFDQGRAAGFVMTWLGTERIAMWGVCTLEDGQWGSPQPHMMIPKGRAFADEEWVAFTVEMDRGNLSLRIGEKLLYSENPAAPDELDLQGPPRFLSLVGSGGNIHWREFELFGL